MLLIIQSLEKELKVGVNDFPELGLCACDLEEDAKERKKRMMTSLKLALTVCNSPRRMFYLD